MSSSSFNIGYIVFLGDTSQQVRCCGVITRWEFNATKTGQIRFSVWREVSSNNYQMVGENVVNVDGKKILMF